MVDITAPLQPLRGFDGHILLHAVELDSQTLAVSSLLVEMSSHSHAPSLNSIANVVDSSFGDAPQTLDQSFVPDPVSVHSTDAFADVKTENSSSFGKRIHRLREHLQWEKKFPCNGSVVEVFLVVISLLSIWATSVATVVVGALSLVSEVRFLV